MVGIDNTPPIDYRTYHFKCRYHTSAWVLPKGTDSVAASAGLNQLNAQFDLIDSKLKTIQTNSATPAPDCYIAVWHGTNTQSLAPSAAPINPTFTWANDFTLTGTPSATFNTSTGLITINTAGYWRITYHIDVGSSTAITEGYISAVLKESGAVAYPVRSLRTLPMETRAGQTSVFKSVLYRVSTATGNFDLDTAKSYYLTAFQENNLANSVALGGTETWLAIEYVRPL